MRYFLEFSYNGKKYHGWQRQPNATTVQEVLESALSTLLRTEIILTAAGRTDAGVHAKQMVAHCDIVKPFDVNELIQRLNSFLPDTIAIHQIMPVKDQAHARFDAISRTYEYWIIQKKNPFMNGLAYYVHDFLNIEVMNEAADVLFDYSDFKCFSKSNTDVKTYLCKIMQAEWEQKQGILVFTIKADRFLRNMVRAIVGTMLEVGYGKKSKEDVKKVIESKNRSQAGVSVPAHALYLTNVDYPSDLFIN
ncbi:tRNA pseudouridine(38-40) synthase TruA [Leptobacterium sp. I13]|uniref:tRNA pseudouridine(38-40) synthase TruA n=1 Tax=Leptobacterium meishanense TaxID=3128904 RepID=UPI0030EBC76A